MLLTSAAIGVTIYTQAKDDISLSSFKIVATAGNADLESSYGLSHR
jgi:hypothetical protein